MMDAPGPLLTIADAARLLKIPPQPIRLAIKLGELKARRVHGVKQPLLLMTDLQAWQARLPVYRVGDDAACVLSSMGEAQIALDASLTEIMLLEKIVGAFAKGQFHWQSEPAGRSVVSNIVGALGLEGIKIDHGTVLSRLRGIEHGGYVLVSGGQPTPAAKARVRGALQRIALGIAMRKLGWTLGASNEAAVTMIMQALVCEGVSVEEDILRRCFKEAEHHLKNSSKPNSDLASAKSD